MKICLLEPFFGGSHRQWAEDYQQHSQHDVDILSLPARHWKWRMHGAAITLAEQYLSAGKNYDLILATDLLDFCTFLSLTRRKTAYIPTALYFHENQLTYPWSTTDPDVALKRDKHYSFIQYTSALAADAVFFNSAYHKKSFLSALPTFLKQFPDYTTVAQVNSLAAKSDVLYLGLDLSFFDAYKRTSQNQFPVLLWNHRWEYDKQPELFFEALARLKDEHLDFRLIVLGESYHRMPAIFKTIEKDFTDQLVHFGYVESRTQYASLLAKADILPVTSVQDFFGASIVEAIYAGCIPLLPRRLAYPEHIPTALHSKYLYEREEDFYPRLKALITNFYEKEKELPNHVLRYDWRTLVPVYDAAFKVISQ
ncbi:MAG TPA: DUF3524 domain-containing protein [Saprospiraceae bacterium]|nr:DUF3524 domain-containing protein [Saprospiraceae bacterium]